METSAVVLNINVGTKPISVGKTFRDKSSKRTFVTPGMCCVSDSVALICIYTVVNTMLARRANNEFTRSAFAQAKELMLSPWRV